jgi:ribose transport system permease protein
MGAGRTEVARAIFGADPLQSGDILVNGRKVSIRTPKHAVANGIGYLSEDRKRFGLATGMDVECNVVMSNLSKYLSMNFFLRKRTIRGTTRRFIGLLNIRTPSPAQQVRLLSGGNQQKIVVAKWLDRDCDILFFDEPTRGIDIGAKSEIYKLLRALADQGKAIVMISSELPEVLRMSDRIVVMCEGLITGELLAEQATQERIMQLATQRATQLMATQGKPRRQRDPMDNLELAQKDGLKADDYGWIDAFKRRLLGPAAMQKVLAFASLVLLLIYFSFASPAFMQTDNMINILQATAVNGVLAIASTFVIITAGIDLSVGTLMTFCAVVAGVFLTYWELPMWTGIVAAMVAGALSGSVSGTLIAKMKIPPFIATLGMMLVLKGLSLVVSGDKPIYFSNTENFPVISQDSLLGEVLPGLPIPNAVLILFVMAILASVVLNRTSLGRYTFAIGSNEEAVRLSGVNVDRWKIIIYSLGGAICGVAGLLLASRINSAQPALGQGYELDAIAAVVIGGTSLSGGAGTILGTIIGAFIMSVLINGLRIMSVAQEWQFVVTGVIIILAVYADMLRHKRG